QLDGYPPFPTRRSSDLEEYEVGSGIPSAILLILQPGETLMVPNELLLEGKADGKSSSNFFHLDLKPGNLMLGQGIFIGLGKRQEDRKSTRLNSSHLVIS